MIKTAEEIVRLLAAIEDPTVDDRDYAPASTCGLCGVTDDEYKHVIGDPTKHEESCPWRLAKEWIGRIGRFDDGR